MGYCAYGGGFVNLKNGVNIPEEILDSLENVFDHVDLNDSFIELSTDYEKYYEDGLYEVLELLTPFIDGGELTYTGEDDYHWKIAFNNGRWNEYPGKIVYDDEPQSTSVVSETDRFEFIGQFIDIFEDFLDEKNVIIPNPERDENDEENQANIYGSDYDRLSNTIEETLRRWGVVFSGTKNNLQRIRIPSADGNNLVALDGVDPEDLSALFGK